MPTTKTRTVNFDNRFQFLLWDYPSTTSTGAVFNDDPYDLFDSKYISFIARVSIDDTSRKPNGDATWDTLTTYTGTNMWKKGNAFNVGHRLADHFEYFGYTSSYFLWKYQGKSYAGGIYVQNWGADAYPLSSSLYIGKGPYTVNASDKIVYQGRSISVGYTSNARASIGDTALAAASNDTLLGLYDFMRHAFRTMRDECDSRGLAYPAYLAWDFESQIGYTPGTNSNNTLVQDVRSSSIEYDTDATGTGCAITAGTPVVHAICNETYAVYAGGKFTSINSVNANNVAKYTTSGWAAVGTGVSLGGVATNATVRCLVESGGYVYVGGNFDSAGGTSVANVARFATSTSTWSALSTGITKSGSAASATVYAVAVFDSKIYFAGDFDSAGGVSVNNIASYNPSNGTWAAVGSGTNGCNGIVYALTTYRKRYYITGTDTTDLKYLVAGGAFTSAGGVSNTSRVAAYYTNNTWYAIGQGVDGDVYALCEADVNFDKTTGTEINTPRRLIIGGDFGNATQTGGSTLSATKIVAWTPTTTLDSTISTGSYSALGTGFDSPVKCLAQPNYSLDIFAGGDFTQDGDSNPMYYFARYDVSNSTWNAVSTGFDNSVYAISPHSINGTYIGGAFTLANIDADTVNYVCKFNNYTRHYDMADIVVGNLMNESPNRYATEIVYEEYNTTTNEWEGKTLQDAFTAAGNPTHVNSIAWQSSTIIRDPKSYVQVNNRDWLRKMEPYFSKMNDWILYKLLYASAKEFFPGMRVGNYSHQFPLNGDIDNFFAGDPRNVFNRTPHEDTTLVQYKPHFRADFQVPVCYAPNPDRYLTTKNATTAQISAENGAPTFGVHTPASDLDQYYFNYHPFGSTNQNIYINMNKQRIKALTALSSETTRFTNLTCIPYAEPPFEASSSSEFASAYEADEEDVLVLWKYWYQRGVRTVFLFNPSMTYYGGANVSRAAASIYGNNLTQSRLLYATVEDFMNWVKSQTGYIRGRNYDA